MMNEMINFDETVVETTTTFTKRDSYLSDTSFGYVYETYGVKSKGQLPQIVCVCARDVIDVDSDRSQYFPEPVYARPVNRAGEEVSVEDASAWVDKNVKPRLKTLVFRLSPEAQALVKGFGQTDWAKFVDSTPLGTNLASIRERVGKPIRMMLRIDLIRGLLSVVLVSTKAKEGVAIVGLSDDSDISEGLFD